MAYRHFARGALGAPIIMAALVAVALLAPSPAFPQAATTPAETGTTVSFAPLLQTAIPYLVDFVLLGLFALAGLVVKWVRDKWKLDMTAALAAVETRHREALHSAIKSAVSGIASKGGNLQIDVRSEAVAQILRYLRDSVPDALEHFNPSNEVIAKIAQAKAVELAAAAPPAVIQVPSEPGRT